MPAHCTIFSSFSFSLPASALPESYWLLIIVLACLSGAVLFIVGCLCVVDFFARRAREKSAEAAGGYVTRAELREELSRVHETVKDGVSEAIRELRTEHKEDARTLHTVSLEVANMKGALEAAAIASRAPH